MKFHEINLPGYVDVVTMPLLIHWKFINLKFLPFDTNEIYLVNVCVSCLLPHRGFLKNRHACFELSHSIEASLRSLSTL